MTVHKCDICGEEVGVWIDIATYIGSKYDTTNVANLTDFVGRRFEVCTNCAEKLSFYINKMKSRKE